MQNLTDIVTRASNNRKALDYELKVHHRASKLAAERGPASTAGETARAAKITIENLDKVYQGLIKEARSVESNPNAIMATAKELLSAGDPDGYIFLSHVHRTLN